MIYRGYYIGKEKPPASLGSNREIWYTVRETFTGPVLASYISLVNAKTFVDAKCAGEIKFEKSAGYRDGNDIKRELD